MPWSWVPTVQGRDVADYVWMAERLGDLVVSQRSAYAYQAYALDRGDTVSLCMVGYVLEKMGRNDEALRCYAQALKLKPNDDFATRLMAEVQLNQ